MGMKGWKVQRCTTRQETKFKAVSHDNRLQWLITSRHFQASQLIRQQGLGNTAFLLGCWILCEPHPPSSCCLSWCNISLVVKASHCTIRCCSFLYLSQQQVAIMMHSSLRTTSPRVVRSDGGNWYVVCSRKNCEKLTSNLSEPATLQGESRSSGAEKGTEAVIVDMS